jgi:hypothetical protein
MPIYDNIPIFEMKLNESVYSLQTIQELTHKNISNIVQTTSIVTAGSRYIRCVFQLFPASSVMNTRHVNNQTLPDGRKDK